jgi:hypothetical protein
VIGTASISASDVRAFSVRVELPIRTRERTNRLWNTGIAAAANSTGSFGAAKHHHFARLDPCRPLIQLRGLDRTGTPFLSFAGRRQTTAAPVGTDLLTFRGDKG